MKRSWVWSGAFTPLQRETLLGNRRRRVVRELKRRKRRAPDRSRFLKDSR